MFQAARANYYAEESEVAPMLFVGRQYWTQTLPVWPLVSALADGRPLATAARLLDDPAEVHGMLTQV